jgi:phosphoribosyl 1,2-cyclic phosphate phosphodiesterase
VYLTFLGTGTSFGIPVVGCNCATCTSEDARDRRTRHGALLEFEAGNVLIDTPPELRLQLLATGVDRVDSVWFTHDHADHLHGIDDLRIFTVRRGTMPAFVAREYAASLERRFEYIFNDAFVPPEGSSKPHIDLHPFDEGNGVEVLGRRFMPLRVPHGDCWVYGFRVGDLGYVTDAKELPEAVVDELQGVDVLVLNALWYTRPHGSHFNIEQAIEASQAVGARRTYLTHLTHRVTQRELDASLPDGVFAAYDGLRVEVDE